MASTLNGPEQGPADGGPARTLVVLLHGVGADGADLIGLAPMFAPALPGAHFIAPDGPEACDMAPFGRQWFSLQDRSPGPVEAGVRAAAPVIDEFIDAELDAHGLANDRLALVGFSQGCMMALHVGLRRAIAPAAVVGFSGTLVAGDTLAGEITVRPPVLLVHGEADPVVPFERQALAEAGLRAAGVDVAAHLRPGLGHSIDEVGIGLANDLLARVLAD